MTSRNNTSSSKDQQNKPPTVDEISKQLKFIKNLALEQHHEK